MYPLHQSAELFSQLLLLTLSLLSLEFLHLLQFLFVTVTVGRLSLQRLLVLLVLLLHLFLVLAGQLGILCMSVGPESAYDPVRVVSGRVVQHLEEESELVEFRRSPGVVFQEAEVRLCRLLEVLRVLESGHVLLECLGAIVSVLVSE